MEFNAPVSTWMHWPRRRPTVTLTFDISPPQWYSGGTPVFGRRAFPDFRSTCSWRVTTYVGKPSATSQPTRPTHSAFLNE